MLGYIPAPVFVALAVLLPFSFSYVAESVDLGESLGFTIKG